MWQHVSWLEWWSLTKFKPLPKIPSIIYFIYINFSIVLSISNPNDKERNVGCVVRKCREKLKLPPNTSLPAPPFDPEEEPLSWVTPRSFKFWKNQFFSPLEKLSWFFVQKLPYPSLPFLFLRFNLCCSLLSRVCTLFRWSKIKKIRPQKGMFLVSWIILWIGFWFFRGGVVCFSFMASLVKE